MSTTLLLGFAVAVLLGGAVAALALARWKRLAGWVSTVCVAVAGAAVWVVVARAFSPAAEGEATVLALPALGARLAVVVDPLSAFFLAIVATIAVVATLYSIDYMTHFEHDTLAKFYPILLVFFAAIIGVLVVADFLFFLVCWELMTLTSFVLVTFERENAASQRAGLKYFVITHAATLCMVVAALLVWRQCGSFHFTDLRLALTTMLAARPLLAHLVLLLFFIGFATKAGVLPMGDWLPDAHPVAPSGMSAALSGALVKLGIYGLVRFFCTLLPATSAAGGWGVMIALAGTASLFVGTLTALRQTDSKRLMAFHTIGQIGYICLGLGVGIACLPSAPALGALAIAGALFHAANHACFKACLFLGAGAVLFRTGERDMNKLGGLAEAMPVTAGSSTVASLAIAGVPPLNGFASKWLIVATCLLAGMSQPLFLVLGLVAMFISLATLASFLKVLGSVFLGMPDPGRRVSEVPATMVAAQVILAALCILLGVFPFWPLRFIRDAVAAAVPVPVPAVSELLGGPWGLSLSAGGVAMAAWAPLALVAGMVVLGLIAYGLQRAGGSTTRQVSVWTCGEEHTAATVRYPASSFYLPFKHAFAGIYPRVRWRVPAFPAAVRRVFDADTWGYLPLARLVERSAGAVSRSHVGVPQVYLVWIVLGAIAVVGIVLGLVR
jgi:hydrogenase-4 component B